MNSLAHIEINVSDLKKSKDFYLKILSQLKWVMSSNEDNSVGFKSPDKIHIFLKQTEKSFISNIFHRKNTGLNHFAFRVGSKEEVEEFSDFLKRNNVPTLYTDKPKDEIKRNESESKCHSSYSGCLNPKASDYDCAGGSGNGPYYTRKVRIIGPDVFYLDRDGDDWGCE